MKLLVDAQLPRKLAMRLKEDGHDVRHTLSLPQANRTTDQLINEISMEEQRILISKDADFVDSFLLQKMPWKLLLVSTGNVSNSDLLELFKKNIDDIENAFVDHHFIEISQTSLIVHS